MHQTSDLLQQQGILESGPPLSLVHPGLQDLDAPDVVTTTSIQMPLRTQGSVRVTAFLILELFYTLAFIMVVDFVSTISEAGEQGGPGFVAGSFVYLLAAPLLFIIGTSSTDILLLRIRYMCIGVKMTIVKGLIATLVATIILIGYSY